MYMFSCGLARPSKCAMTSVVPSWLLVLFWSDHVRKPGSGLPFMTLVGLLTFLWCSSTTIESTQRVKRRESFQRYSILLLPRTIVTRLRPWNGFL